MMDIVKRLRDWRDPSGYLGIGMKIREEAADEIERLREANKQLAIDAHREESKLRVELEAVKKERDEFKRLTEKGIAECTAWENNYDQLNRSQENAMCEMQRCLDTVTKERDTAEHKWGELLTCQEQLAACQKDAERYRWFAERCPYLIFSVNYETNGLDVVVRGDRMWDWGKEQLDAAIDAAMKDSGIQKSDCKSDLQIGDCK